MRDSPLMRMSENTGAQEISKPDGIKTARDSHGLNGLVDGTGADTLDVDGYTISDHAGDGAGNGRGR